MNSVALSMPAAVLALGITGQLAEVAISAALGAGVVGLFSARRLRHSKAEAHVAASVEANRVGRLEEQHRDVEETLSVLGLGVRSLPLGLIVLDARGRELARNPMIDSVLGASNGPTDGRVETRTDGEVMAGGTLRRLLERAASGQRGRESLEIVGPPRRSYLLAAEPIGEPTDGRYACVGTLQDVSEQRRIEAMRQDFISNVSHELRTPVGAIAILAETLVGETDRTSVNRLTGRLEHEAHRLSAMIDDLLALGNVESGGTVNEEFVPVPELIDEAIERARVSAETRRLSIDVDEVGQGLLVRGDRRQLVTALHNLLENALKYSDKGLPVTVRAGQVDHDPDGNPRVAIGVMDHGIGIPARDQERIFERFYRVDRARARDTGGTGLGLAIVRHVVRNHDGEVAVTSTEGEGSTFTLLLPGHARYGTASERVTASTEAGKY